MQLNKRKGFLFALILAFFSVNVFAATTDLSARFLDKANESYENGNTDEAYKYVNQALTVAKDEAAWSEPTPRVPRSPWMRRENP